MGVTEGIPAPPELLAEKIRFFQPPNEPGEHTHAGFGFATFNAVDRIPRDTTLQPQRINAQPTGFPQFL